MLIPTQFPTRFSSGMYLRCEVELDFTVTFGVELVEAAGNDSCPLGDESGNEEVVADCAIAILL